MKTYAREMAAYVLHSRRSFCHLTLEFRVSLKLRLWLRDGGGIGEVCLHRIRIGIMTLLTDAIQILF